MNFSTDNVPRYCFSSNQSLLGTFYLWFFYQFPLKPFHLSLKNWLGKLICQLERFCPPRRVNSSQVNVLGARSSWGAGSTSTWTFRPPRCGNTSGNSSSRSTTVSPRAGPRYRSGSEPWIRQLEKTLTYKPSTQHKQKQCRILSGKFLSNIFILSFGQA